MATSQTKQPTNQERVKKNEQIYRYRQKSLLLGGSGW